MISRVTRRQPTRSSVRAVETLESRLLLATFQPLTSAALTSAINSAHFGDTIVLKAGTSYTGQFVLPNKTTGTGWITIQSSALSSLPAAGVRVGPANAVNMPRLVSPGGNASVVKTNAGAHNFKFVGIEFVGPANNSDLVALIE